MKTDTPTNSTPRLRRITVPLEQRAAYTPSEFAAMHGKERTWAYRLIQQGKIRTIEGLGTKLVPRTEIERLAH